MKRRFNIFFLTLIALLSACNPTLNTKNGNTTTVIPLTDSTVAVKSVFLTKDYFGNAVLCWTEAQDNSDSTCFFYAIWNNEKNRFGDKMTIPTVPNISLHDESMPKIIFGKSGLITAIYEVKLPGQSNHYASQLEYVQSKDFGKTWSQVGFVSKDTSLNASRSYFDITTLPNGAIAVCWLGNSNGKGRPLKFTKTDSFGHFLLKGKYELILDSFACQCCRTAITTDSSGNIDIAYREIAQGNIRDIALVSSPDNGKSFGPPQGFSNDNWKVMGCPHNGPDIVSNSETVFVSWYSGGKKSGAYYCELNRATGAMNKQLINKSGQKAQLCFLKNGNRLVVYNQIINDSNKIASIIKAKVFPSGKSIVISENPVKAYSPVVIPLNNGAMIAWLQDINGKNRVVYKLIHFK